MLKAAGQQHADQRVLVFTISGGSKNQDFELEDRDQVFTTEKQK